MEKTIHDPIHGNITLSPLILQFIDTKEFQRLRNIRQLGCCYYVFPGATHARFEHSIGVHHLCGIMLTKLQSKQPELNITDRQVELIKIAGLLHDIGHGCFSHAFDDIFMNSPETTPTPGSFLSFTHEERSCLIVAHMVDKYNIPLSKSEVHFIQSLIDPHHAESPDSTDLHESHESSPSDHFIYQILANKVNGLDCDKFDYIQRDAYNLGIQGNTINFERIIDGAKVIDGIICYPYKDMFTIAELYRARYRLHRQVYTHHTVQQIELMITDCLKASKLVDVNMDIDTFINIDDSILTIIRTHSPMSPMATSLLDRINNRKLYSLVGEVHRKCHYTADDFHNNATESLQEDLVVKHMKIGYTGKDMNPLDNFRFYTRKSPNESFTFKNFNESQQTHGGLLPQQFDECICRVFCKNPHKLGCAKDAFQKTATTTPPIVPPLAALQHCRATHDDDDQKT